MATAMPVAKRGFAHVVLDEKIYIIGGCDEQSRVLNSVEYYEVKTNRWQTVKPTLNIRSNPIVCTAGGFIYVLGGVDNRGPLDIIEKYDPAEDKWIEVGLI